MSQLALSFNSKESPEVIDLVSRAKKGDDEAGNLLFEKYRKTLHGDFISKKLHYNMNQSVQDSEEAHSIMHVIFMNSIHSYDSTKSKFITHLVNMIKYQFRDYLMREKLVSVKKHLSSDKMNELIEKTAVVFSTPSEFEISNVEKYVNFNIHDENFSMPEKVFIGKFIKDRAKVITPVSQRKVYQFYIQSILDGEKSPKKKVCEKFNLDSKKFYILITRCNEIVKQSLEIKDVSYV